MGISKDELEAVLESMDKVMGTASRAKSNPNLRDPNFILKLREAYKNLHKPEIFSPGDVVVAKNGFDVYKMNGPFIVDSLIEEPTVTEKDGDSPYFCEPLDMVVCTLAGDPKNDDDKVVLRYAVTKARFRHLTPDELAHWEL